SGTETIGMSGTRRKAGPLTAFVPGYRCKLLALGYTSETVRGLLKVLGQLGRWMTDNEVAVSQLDWETIEHFLAYRSADSFRQMPHRPGLRLLLELLVDEHVVKTQDPAPLTGLGELLRDYRQWLIEERGLAETTVLRYQNCARRFLGPRTTHDGAVAVACLTGIDVSAFLLAEAQRCSIGASKGRVAELRALLRYLYLRGSTPTLLSGSIPPVAGWRDTTIPPSLSRGDVTALLDGCDRSTVSGLRDFAMLMLLARLGLRSIEVARLELDDIDWRSGEIRVRGKSRRIDRMPLPVEVGDAVSAYLLDGRPRTQHRQVFLTLHAPIRGVHADLLGDVVRRSCARAGLPVVGAHRLRHALATALLSDGVHLVDISAVLRHRDLATTAIYAKVDISSLRGVAQPWPGALR
ncbi:MAG: site-specific integrase, partial [Mycobacterium sp.]